MKNRPKILLTILAALLLVVVALGLIFGRKLKAFFLTWIEGRNTAVIQYIRNPEAHRDWELPAHNQCPSSPFAFPSSGFVGYFYGDSFSPFKLHTGLDIFGGNPVGETPIYAPYDGFLTRQEDWTSTVILRIPKDPLMPDRQIWIYMTHMADVDGNPLIDANFPVGTFDKPVAKGDLIGYQGNYSGYPGTPTGIHLHLSIVKDDGQGNYLNELEITNTLDPSPYFGMQLNANQVQKTNKIPVCIP